MQSYSIRLLSSTVLVIMELFMKYNKNSAKTYRILRFSSILSAKLLIRMLRLIGKGGTTLPGKLALRDYTQK